MSKILHILLSTLTALSLTQATLSFAQEVSPTPSPAPALKRAPQVRDILQEQTRKILERTQDKKQEVREKTEETRVKVETRNQEAREKLKERTEETRKKVDETRKTRIREYWARMIARLEAAISRESKLADRIESRINKFAEAGKDVSAAREQLRIARGKIEEAKSALAAAKSRIEEVVNSETPKTAFGEVRENLTKAVVAKIKEAHQALTEVLRVLKGLSERVKPTPTASPTPSE